MLLLLISAILAFFPAKIAEGFAIVEAVSYAIVRFEEKTLRSNYLKALLTACIIIPSTFLGVSPETIGAALVIAEVHHVISKINYTGTLRALKFIVIYTLSGIAYFLFFCKVKNLSFNIPYIVFLALVGSLAASLMEYVGSEEIVDIVIILATVTTYVIFTIYAIHTTLTYLAEAFAISFILSVISTKAGVADESGLLSATLIGMLIIIFTDIRYFIIMLLFYAIGSAATKYMYKTKYERGIAEPAGGARGYINVFSNSLPALFFAINYGFYGIEVFKLAFVASIATALGDTMASEIGKTSEKVYLITNFKRVKPGVNGGVSIKGELAAIFGCLIVPAIAVLLSIMDAKSLPIVFAASFLGVHIDSLLGATLEEKGLLTNAGVNFLATLSGGLLCLPCIYVLCS